MNLPRRILIPTMLTLGGGLITAPARAQLYGPGSASLQTYAFTSAGNLTPTGGINLLANVFQSSSTGALVTATGSQSFSGLDSQGRNQTMTLSGNAKAVAGYGLLHAYAKGSVVNPYYNASNPIYFNGPGSPDNHDDGSPQYLETVGQALFNDTLTLNSFSDSVAKVRYLFHIDGSVVDDQHDYAYLAFSAGSNSTVFFTSPGVTTADWATPDWDVTPGGPISLSGNFGAVFMVNANYYNTPEGQTVDGTADFFNTLTLTGIQFLDANGDQVNGVRYLTASGTAYNVLGGTYGAPAGSSSVPEPGSIMFLAGIAVPGAALVFRKYRAV